MCAFEVIMLRSLWNYSAKAYYENKMSYKDEVIKSG